MFKFNKIFALIVVMCICFLSFSCKLFKEELIDNEGVIILDIEEEFKEYFPYELPKYEINFEGVIRTTKHRTTTREVIFTKNDDFKLSEILSNIFNQYKEKDCFRYSEYKVHKEAETYLISYENKKDGEKVYMKVKDKKIYDEVSYINLDNGLVLSTSYARIVDVDDNVYYRWRDSEATRMILHYPFMVTENENNETIFLLIPLPAGIIYGFDTTTKDLETLLTKDKFKTDKSYYTYDYLNGWNKESVKDFYMKRCNGRVIDDNFYIDFYGYTFKVEFNSKSFVLSHVK